MSNHLAKILTKDFGSDFTHVWNNVLRAEACNLALNNFALDKTVETTTFLLISGDIKIPQRAWNSDADKTKFKEMFEELCEFLLAQPSDDLALATMRTGIRRFFFFHAY